MRPRPSPRSLAPLVPSAALAAWALWIAPASALAQNTPTAVVPGVPAVPVSSDTNASLTAGMTDILDIKPMASLPPDWTWLWWLLAGLAAVGLIAAGYLLWRRWRARSRAVPPPPPAHEVATQALDLLEQDAPPPREHYFRLSTIFRGYVEAAFGCNALEMTTEELLPRLAELPLHPDLADRSRAFLRAAEPVKFAGLSTTTERMKADRDLVREVVQRTTPTEEEPHA